MMTTRLGFALLLLACAARAQEIPRAKDTDMLLLDVSKVNLGTITSDDDKKKYIYTIQLEKARITRKTLGLVYENAFDLYKQGEYEGARELTSKILAIDPAYQDASVLQRATIELRGSKKPIFSERKLVEDRFEEGMALYRQGRMVEATDRWEEAAKLAPENLKTKYWLKKARGELADDHFRRGQKAYRQHRLKETLDQWYAALVLNPRYPRLTSAISKVESEAREQDGNEKLQTALNLYSQGETVESLKMLDQVLEAGPGNTKAQKLMAEIRSEMAAQHVAAGRTLYETRKYQDAIKEWKSAVDYGYDPKAADQLVARAKEQMRREDAARTAAARRAEDAKKKAEVAAAEAKKKADDDAAAAKKKADDDAAAAKTAATTGGTPPAGTPPGGRGAVSGENRQQSQQHYLSGMIYYQKQDYEKARDEWNLAKQLDPSNADADAGLQRIEKLYGGNQ
ncbi:MAG: tetratricopeptide repeat protein [Elusimicrobia bacterium]|nr:tetratricopeptide repeat protein [Elusimicrobiota bacterium]